MQHPICLARGLSPHRPHTHNSRSLLHTRLSRRCSLSRQPGFCSSTQGSRPFLQHSRDSSSVVARCSGSPTDSDNESNDISTEEANETVKKLQRLNSIQRGYLDRQNSGKQDAQDDICCWGKEGDGLPRTHTSRRGVANQVQLSVYPDCIGDNLADLNAFLQKHINGAIGSVHMLPLYPSTGDRGFAPVTFQNVDSEFGTWSNVRDLGSEYQLCLEFMPNHISPQSEPFRDFLQNGEASHYKSMFVHWEDIWPGGKPTAEQLARIRTRKPAPPVIEATLADGSKVPLWNTFGDQQIDINPFSEEGWRFVEASLVSLCHNGGAKLIRLDAFGYVTKKAGTGCFMEEPEVWDLLQRIGDVVKPFGVELLCEIHEDFNLNIQLAKHGYWVYDFALPMLLLHALKFRTAESLKHWLSICPRRQITTLDTHDGMGVDDVTGLASLVDVREVEQSILCLGGTVNYKHYYNPTGKGCCGGDTSDSDADHPGKSKASSRTALEAVQDYLQPDCMKGCYTSVQHQYNATYFSATQEDPRLYLMARAVQFFTPGVPMVYYVGLLAGRNDYELLEKGGIRDINRHHYSVKEAEQELQRPVVQALLKLCRFRNYHPAFKGRVFVDDSTPPYLLRVCWYHGTKHLAVLRADFQAQRFSISHTPYKTPVAADEAVEHVDLEDGSLDVTELFKLDALEIVDRADKRRHLYDSVADLGIVDPVELVAMQRVKQREQFGQEQSGRSSRLGINGSSVAGNSVSETSSSVDEAASASNNAREGASAVSVGAVEGFQVAREWPSLGRYDPETDRFVGGSADGGADGQELTGEEQLALNVSSEASGLTQQGNDWGLLQLDLAFAWEKEDQPVEDVGRLQQEVPARQAQVQAQTQA